MKAAETVVMLIGMEKQGKSTLANAITRKMKVEARQDVSTTEVTRLKCKDDDGNEFILVDTPSALITNMNSIMELSVDADIIIWCSNYWSAFDRSEEFYCFNTIRSRLCKMSLSTGRYYQIVIALTHCDCDIDVTSATDDPHGTISRVNKHINTSWSWGWGRSNETGGLDGLNGLPDAYISISVMIINAYGMINMHGSEKLKHYVGIDKLKHATHYNTSFSLSKYLVGIDDVRNAYVLNLFKALLASANVTKSYIEFANAIGIYNRSNYLQSNNDLLDYLNDAASSVNSDYKVLYSNAYYVFKARVLECDYSTYIRGLLYELFDDQKFSLFHGKMHLINLFKKRFTPDRTMCVIHAIENVYFDIEFSKLELAHIKVSLSPLIEACDASVIYDYILEMLTYAQQSPAYDPTSLFLIWSVANTRIPFAKELILHITFADGGACEFNNMLPVLSVDGVQDAVLSAPLFIKSLSYFAHRNQTAYTIILDWLIAGGNPIKKTYLSFVKTMIRQLFSQFPLEEYEFTNVNNIRFFPMISYKS